MFKLVLPINLFVHGAGRRLTQKNERLLAVLFGIPTFSGARDTEISNDKYNKYLFRLDGLPRILYC